jgi:hypothetical protein
VTWSRSRIECRRITGGMFRAIGSWYDLVRWAELSGHTSLGREFRFTAGLAGFMVVIDDYMPLEVPR